MSATKPSVSPVDIEAVSMLREAWRHVQGAERLINQARQNATDFVVIEGLLLLALEHTEKSRTAIERAAKLITTSAAARSRL